MARSMYSLNYRPLESHATRTDLEIVSDEPYSTAHWIFTPHLFRSSRIKRLLWEMEEGDGGGGGRVREGGGGEGNGGATRSMKAHHSAT